MGTFEIETYKVSAHLRRYPRAGGGASTVRERALHMVGPLQYHGIQNKAIFVFSDQFNSFNADAAGYVSDGGFDGLTVVGWFPRHEFGDYYDIVRAESPVSVEFFLRDAGAYSGYARTVGLNTGAEPVGEGPADTEAALANALQLRVRGTMASTSLLPPVELAVLLDPVDGVELSPEAARADD